MLGVTFSLLLGYTTWYTHETTHENTLMSCLLPNFKPDMVQIALLLYTERFFTCYSVFGLNEGFSVSEHVHICYYLLFTWNFNPDLRHSRCSHSEIWIRHNCFIVFFFFDTYGDSKVCKKLHRNHCLLNKNHNHILNFNGVKSQHTAGLNCCEKCNRYKSQWDMKKMFCVLQNSSYNFNIHTKLSFFVT